MATTMTATARQPQGKALDLPLIGATPRRQPTVKTPDAGLWVLPVVARAIDIAMSRKEAAIRMHMDEGQLSRQLGGEGHLSVPRLGALGQRFWIALADELRQEFGINDPAAEARHAAELITQGMSILLARVK